MDILARRLNVLSIFEAQSLFRSSGQILTVSCSTSFSDVPVIKTPQKMVRRLEKLRERKKTDRRTSQPKAKGPLIISCQRKGYNFHRHEKFRKEEDFFKLVSCGWRNRKRNGDSFTLKPHADNPSIQHEVLFGDLGLNKQLCERLQGMGYETPTEIQRLTIPPFLRGDHIVCAAETGSGKTLSYLLPMVERISHQKRTLRRRGAGGGLDDSDTGNPYSIVITPTRELTEQVAGVAQSLASSTDVIPQGVVGGALKKRDLKRYTDDPMDVLITTPGILNRMICANCLKRSNLQSIVIDESDTLLDDSFLDDIHSIFHGLQVSISGSSAETNSPFLDGIQLALVSATMPRDLHNAVGHIVPVDTMTKVTSKGLHYLMPHVPQTFHRINPDSKPVKLVSLLKKSQEKQEVCLVFAKNSQTTFYLRELLRDNGIQSLIMNGELTNKEREGVFSQFMEGYSDVLIATDIASRGLDTTNVHHVINYDFPNFLSDYVHRVGRVGRMGAKHDGHASSFVAHKWDVELLWKIETAARMGDKLENVNANIKRKLQGLYADSGIFTVNEIF